MSPDDTDRSISPYLQQSPLFNPCSDMTMTTPLTSSETRCQTTPLTSSETRCQTLPPRLNSPGVKKREMKIKITRRVEKSTPDISNSIPRAVKLTEFAQHNPEVMEKLRNMEFPEMIMEHTNVTVRPKRRISRSKRGRKPPREKEVKHDREKLKEVKHDREKLKEVKHVREKLKEVKHVRAGSGDTEPSLKGDEESDQIVSSLTSVTPTTLHHLTSPDHLISQDQMILPDQVTPDDVLLQKYHATFGFEPVMSSDSVVEAERKQVRTTCLTEEYLGDIMSCEQWVCWFVCTRYDHVEWSEIQVLAEQLHRIKPGFVRVRKLSDFDYFVLDYLI